MGGRLTASMVVDLTDKTGAKTQVIIGNLNRLKRAERDFMLADRGVRLSDRDRAMERLMMAREASIAERQAAMNAWMARGATAAAVVGYGAARAYKDAAQLEREIGRIVINADKGREAIDPIVSRLRQIADDNRMPFENVVEGFKELIASGRELDEALAFLPSVALTAQASGSAVADIARTADAVAGALKVSAGDMQTAFDDLVEGGKAGKFELEQMSQYLPSLAPAFAALGNEGTEGLAKLVARLQVVRMQTGTSAEAATNFSNVIAKIYSAETANKFQKNFGIDLPAALDKTRAAGGDVLEKFIELSRLATKGDLTKLSKIFEDQEAQKGLRAMMMLGDEYLGLLNEISAASGTARRDAGQIFDDSQSKLDRLSNNWDAFVKNVGKGVAVLANPLLETVNESISRAEAQSRAMAGKTAEERAREREKFDREYRRRNPGAYSREANRAYGDALERVGRGQARDVFEAWRVDDGREAGGRQTARYPSRGSYGPGSVPEGLGAGPETGATPVPGARPTPADMARRRQEAMEQALYGYPSRGTYDADAEVNARRFDRERRRQALRAADPATLGMAGMGGITIEQAGAAAPEGPREVTISGTPAVTITNPPPRPNINVQMSVTINEAQDPQAVARQLGQAVRDEMNGLQASTNDSGL